MHLLPCCAVHRQDLCLLAQNQQLALIVPQKLVPLGFGRWQRP